MFRTPSCPNCGSVYLVIRMRTNGDPRTESGSVKKYYRCFRCFHKFSEADTESTV